MPLQAITYNDIIALLRNYITANCKNIDNNYNSLPSEFKSGYSKRINLTSSGSIRTYCTESIIKSVPKVTIGTVNNDINNFLSTIHVTDKLNTNVVASEFIDFINNLVTFCATKLCFATSSYVSSRYLVYIASNTKYMNIKNIDNTEVLKQIANTEVNDILISIIDVVNQLIRPYTCTYRTTFGY